jgi:hypothetical protein
MQAKNAIFFTLFLLGWFLFRATEAWAAGSCELIPLQSPGRLARVELKLEVAGKLKLPEDAKVNTLSMQVLGTAKYEERLLRSPDRPGGPIRSIRKYATSAARLTIDGQATERVLSADRQLLVADWSDDRLWLFDPQARLTREELDLVTVPCDSLLLDFLAPSQAMSVGQRWQHTPELLAALLGIDAVKSADVHSELTEVDGPAARCQLAGKLEGAVNGAGTQIELKAKYTFHIEARRVVWLAMVIKEQRAIGHAAPGVEATSRLQVTIQPITESESLPSDIARLTTSPTPAALLLRYVPKRRTFQFDYDRRWNLMSDDDKGSVFRFIDGGEFVAQLNVLPVSKTEAGKPVSLSRFQADVQQALGDSFGQFVVASQNGDDPGRLVYRVVATGKTQELPIQWTYYLITSSSGEQALLIFTAEASLVERFGNADRPIVDSLHFMSAATQTAARPPKRR